MALAVALFAALVLGFIAFSAGFGRAFLTAPILFMVAGALVGRIEAFASIDHAVIQTIAEVTLALLLFHDASQLQPRELRADAPLTGRLLLVGLPLTIAAGFLLARVMFPGIGVWLALLLAAALAPTDAGLGAATVLNPVVPVRVRRVLNVESGLNDGLATPVVLFAVAAAAGTSGSTQHTFVTSLLEIAIGAAIGSAVGFLGGKLLDVAHDRGWSQQDLVPVAVLVLPLLAYYAAHGAGGNGFISAFVAGTMFALAQVDLDRMHGHLELTDQVAALLGFAVWMLFGTALAHHLGALTSLPALGFAVLSLTVLRMVPVALCLLGSGLRPQSVLFIGWFGPRGLASVVFALIALEELDLSSEVSKTVGVIATTVVLSVVLHGYTATTWAGRYGAWASGPAHPSIENQATVAPRRTSSRV